MAEPQFAHFFRLALARHKRHKHCQDREGARAMAGGGACPVPAAIP